MTRSLYRSTICLALLSLSVAACSKTEEQPPPPAKREVQLSDELTGEALFNERCRDCHQVNGKGGTVGPDLTGVASRRDRAYLEQAIREPAKLYPGSVMPHYDTFSIKQVKSLVDYLATLK